MAQEFLTVSAEETREIARRFATELRAGDVVCLTGQLGAGKTEFIRGIAEVFNCDDQLTSPTFSLFNIYEGSLRGLPFAVHHFDLYRIESSKELETLGFEEYLCGPFISVVEWGEKFSRYAGLYTRWVTITIAGEHERRIVIT
jgi:tRNA threonylcarbamoyladenosine biosynthesis protein TsaE